MEDAPHRPRAQAGVAVEYRRDRTAGDRPHGKPAAGAGIAEIEGRGRLGKAAHADTPDAPRLLADTLKLRAQRPHGVDRAHGVLAFEHAVDAGFPDGESAKDQPAPPN